MDDINIVKFTVIMFVLIIKKQLIYLPFYSFYFTINIFKINITYSKIFL